jgi:hypothetical protein
MRIRRENFDPLKNLQLILDFFPSYAVSLQRKVLQVLEGIYRNALCDVS